MVGVVGSNPIVPTKILCERDLRFQVPFVLSKRFFKRVLVFNEGVSPGRLNGGQ